MIDYNCKDLAQALIQIGINNRLGLSYKCDNFIWFRSCIHKFRHFLSIVQVKEENLQNSSCLYLGKGWCNFLHTWYVVTPYKQVPLIKFYLYIVLILQSTVLPCSGRSRELKGFHSTPFLLEKP